MKRIGIVGAGLGGLAAAIELQNAGFEVEVFDQAPDPGGKAAQRKVGPFRFDTGPSLVTLASVWDELFAATGRRREDYFRMVPLDPIAQYFWFDAQLTAPGNPAGLARSLAEKGWAPAATTMEWFDRIKALYELASPVFLGRSLHDSQTWTRSQTWATLIRAWKLDAGRSLRTAIAETFPNPRVRQFFGRYATYNGSSPERTPATFAMIPWVEYGLGAWAVEGGIHQIPRAMQKLATELGVKFHFSTPVNAIVHDRGSIEGIKIKRELLPFDGVVSNADVGPTYGLLQSGGPLNSRQTAWRERYRRGEPSTSGVVFLWGIDTSFANLGLHNVFFSPDYDAEFRALFDERRLPDDPTVYVNITSKTVPGDAPPGQENWFVMVNAPHDSGSPRIVDRAAVDRLREAVLRRIEANLGTTVRPHIVQEAVITPADIEASTGSPGGSLYGLASHKALAAFRRHPNRAPGFQGLYICGGSAHPGGGMPLAVLSGRIAADLATRDLRP